MTYPVNQSFTRGSHEGHELHQILVSELAEIHERHGGLPSPLEAEDTWAEIWCQETHHSTALAGNGLTLKEVQAVLLEGRVIGHKELKDYLEVRGYAEAVRWVYGQGFKASYRNLGFLLSLGEVRHLHRVSTTPAWAVAPDSYVRQEGEGPGRWRLHEVARLGREAVPPSPDLVPKLLEGWLARISELEEARVSIPEMMAEFHASFQRIRPFADGNGRTGRLLMNLVLIRLGYPPAIILRRDRSRYLQALGRADLGDLGQLGDLIALAILDIVRRLALLFEPEPVELLTLADLATPAISVVALRNAAERSRLKALRTLGGSWRSTRRWVDEYLARRYR